LKKIRVDKEKEKRDSFINKVGMEILRPNKKPRINV